MRAAALAIALLMSGAAVAQTTNGTDTTPNNSDMSTSGQAASQTDATDATTQTDATATSDMNATSQTDMASNMATATGAVVQPDNSNPRRDARGIAVISEAAVVPIGWNGVQGAAMGGPLVDPNTGQTVDTTSNYPACSRSVTDKCVQTYERHRAR
ncbi:MAG: hypothetical protein JWO81_1429 [Alphaproteobacteria bacterium]|nr:hypothetical protein [Alphaproteobacteria bacterium]